MKGVGRRETRLHGASVGVSVFLNLFCMRPLPRPFVTEAHERFEACIAATGDVVVRLGPGGAGVCLPERCLDLTCYTHKSIIAHLTQVMPFQSFVRFPRQQWYLVLPTST